MNEVHKDGGRAFPCDQIIERDANGHLHGKEVASGGMTLRDYFAGQALPAYFSNVEDHGCFAAATKWAYEMADAMLKARQS